ncbi:hypothetical protein GCM10009836_72940 [Pseudonocardia ailaonensis]|uniref:Uncharacterized protein n=1 Tax=Pseudonocardia ailaonensis TaxID=367279 RepID=A0ABN2NTT3_9PSEU
MPATLIALKASFTQRRRDGSTNATKAGRSYAAFAAHLSTATIPQSRPHRTSTEHLRRTSHPLQPHETDLPYLFDLSGRDLLPHQQQPLADTMIDFELQDERVARGSPARSSAGRSSILS